MKNTARTLFPAIAADRDRRWEQRRRLRDGVPSLARQLPPVVAAGPFEGMRLPNDRIEEIDAPVPKLLGLYEQELHPVLETAILERRPFVDIGSADGYYAVGMATRGIPTTAYDIARSARQLAQHVAHLNDVTYEQRGAFTPPPPIGAFVLCDIEGAERDLFTSPFPYVSCRLLIEVHDHIRPGTAAYLRKTFAVTHNVTRIDQRPRERPAALEGWERWETAVSEYRADEVHWLHLEPR